MSERKTAQIVVLIEPTLRDIINEVDDGNTSAYLRELIVQDLYARGKLTIEVLKQILAPISTPA